MPAFAMGGGLSNHDCMLAALKLFSGLVRRRYSAVAYDEMSRKGRLDEIGAEHRTAIFGTLASFVSELNAVRGHNQCFWGK